MKYFFGVDSLKVFKKWKTNVNNFFPGITFIHVSHLFYLFITYIYKFHFFFYVIVNSHNFFPVTGLEPVLLTS